MRADYKAHLLGKITEARHGKSLSEAESKIVEDLLATHQEFIESSLQDNEDEDIAAGLEEAILELINSELNELQKTGVSAEEVSDPKSVMASPAQKEPSAEPVPVPPTPMVDATANPLSAGPTFAAVRAEEDKAVTATAEPKGMYQHTAAIPSVVPASMPQPPVAYMPVGGAPVVVAGYQVQPQPGAPARAPATYPLRPAMAPMPGVVPAAKPNTHYHSSTSDAAGLGLGIVRELGAAYGQYQVTSDIAHGRPVEMGDVFLASMGHDGRRGLNNAVVDGVLLHAMYGNSHGAGTSSAHAVSVSDGGMGLTAGLEHVTGGIQSAIATGLSTVGDIGRQAVNTVSNVNLSVVSDLAHGAVSSVGTFVQPAGEVVGGIVTAVGNGLGGAAQTATEFGRVVVEAGGNVAGVATNCCGFFAQAGDCLGAVPEAATACCASADCLGGCLDGALELVGGLLGGRR